MPIMKKPITWNKEYGHVNGVSDPRNRYRVGYKPPCNPFLYRKAYNTAVQIFDIVDSSGFYNIWESPEMKFEPFFQNYENILENYPELIYVGPLWDIDKCVSSSSPVPVNSNIPGSIEYLSPGWCTTPYAYENIMSSNYETCNFRIFSNDNLGKSILFFIPFGLITESVSENLIRTSENLPPETLEGIVEINVTELTNGGTLEFISADSACPCNTTGYNEKITINNIGKRFKKINLYSSRILIFKLTTSHINGSISSFSVKISEVKGSNNVFYVPPTKKHITKVDLNINPNKEIRPRLRVTELETEKVPIRFDYIEDHLRLQFFKSKFNEDYTKLENKYKHGLFRWAEISSIYDIFITLLFGSSNINENTLIFKRLKKVVEDYKIGLSDEILLDILEKGFKFYSYDPTLSTSNLKKFIKLIDVLKEEFYKRRFRSVLQYFT